jgi:hypothetical protein
MSFNGRYDGFPVRAMGRVPPRLQMNASGYAGS